MIYYTIYVRGLDNGTGYIDVSLEDDQLLKDYLQFLDVRLPSHRSYPMASPAGSRAKPGSFAVNMTDVTAISIIPG